MSTRTWADDEGVELFVRSAENGEFHAMLDRTPNSAVMALSREQATELRDMLSQHLLDTDPHPHGPTEEQLEASGVQSSVAVEAHGLVYGDRGDHYGHPREDFTRQAIIWTGLLHHKLADGVHLEAEDIARCMIGTKLARDVHAPKRDNRVDGAGYFICLDRLETGK